MVSGRSVRLLPATGFSHPKDSPYEIGDVWDLELQEIPRCELKAPHSEDVRVIRSSFIQTRSTRKLKNAISRYSDPPIVEPSEVFCGFLHFNDRQRGLIVPKHGIPVFSTGFWRFKKALHRQQDDYGSTRYLYCNNFERCGFDDPSLLMDVKYVGCAEAISVIPPGAILRFSLSHLYKGGFWLQLSGWFI